jgi:hypothetical protein
VIFSLTGFRYRGLAPQYFTPMMGALRALDPMALACMHLGSCADLKEVDIEQLGKGKEIILLVLEAASHRTDAMLT